MCVGLYVRVRVRVGVCQVFPSVLYEYMLSVRVVCARPFPLPLLWT